ncbi:MAG: hypothetical protein ACREQ9_11625, partial [Candidatus Binatia bacterium]
IQTYSHFAITLGGAGAYRRVLEIVGEGVRLGESIGDRVWRARLWNTRGWVLGELGAFEEAEEANRRCIEIAGQIGASRLVSELIGNAEANLADGALAQGDLSGAEPHLAAVAAILGDRQNEWMTWRYGMHYRASAAELALARGDVARARQLVSDCLATAQRTRSRRYVIRGERLLAALHVASGDLVEGERTLAVVVEAARALGNPAQLWQALLAHGRALHALGRRDEAVVSWREALDLAGSVAATLPDAAASSFRRSPLVTSLEELA